MQCIAIVLIKKFSIEMLDLSIKRNDSRIGRSINLIKQLKPISHIYTKIIKRFFVIIWQTHYYLYIFSKECFTYSPV